MTGLEALLPSSAGISPGSDGNPLDGRFYCRGNDRKPFYALSQVFVVEASSVTGREVRSSPAIGDTYRLDEPIEIALQFSEKVTVQGAPWLNLAIGAGRGRADYAYGSGTDTLVFRYAVQAGDRDTNGFQVIGNDGIVLDGATIRTLNGVDVDTVVRRRHLTPRNRSESTCHHADRRPICTLNNTPALWNRTRKEAGIEDVRVHDLRHTVASQAVAKGVALSTVARMLGHSDPKMTLRYAHVSDRDVEAAAERIGKVIETAMETDRAIDGAPSRRSPARPTGGIPKRRSAPTPSSGAPGRW